MLTDTPSTACAVQVAGISGSGQQHGSVWWRRGSASVLSRLDPSQLLSAQLSSSFSLPNAPIWMDSSTHEECVAIESAVGGAGRLAELTGSRAYERFTGNQIRRVARLFPHVYEDTERISLVSSMLACVLTGRYQPIDASDAAGMNCMNIRSQQWEPTILQAIDASGQLLSKLGERVAPSNEVVGSISPYFVQRYGFSADCRVVACSGDNPCTLAGLELTELGDVGVSLGTSDTLFAVVSDAKPSEHEGHVFINPVDPRTAMLMAVFKNGSLTRQAVRDRVCGGDWTAFNAGLSESQPGNGGRLMFTYLEAEITPTVHRTGVFRFDAQDAEVASFDSVACEVRALIEGQFLSLKSHARHLGLSQPKRIVASGGASVNQSLLQVLADVFQCEVQVQVVKDTRTGQDASALNNTAALGAALRAMWAVQGKQQSAHNGQAAAVTAAGGGSGGGGDTVHGSADGVSARVSLHTAARPRPATSSVYDSLLSRFERLEKLVVAKLQ